MSEFDSINQEQRLYVLREAGGYSCLGFDVANRWLRDVLAWLPEKNRPMQTPEEMIIPSRDHYNFYLRVMNAGSLYASQTKTRCPAQLTPQLIGLEGKRVEITAPGHKPTRFWVGKSTGWLPIHLEIKQRNSSGGCAVYLPEGATVRVVDARR